LTIEKKCIKYPYTLKKGKIMTYDDLINFFGTLAKASYSLKKPCQSIQLWKKKGYIPISVQCYIEMATEGALKADRTKIEKIKASD
jgi:hypothetical protein